MKRLCLAVVLLGLSACSKPQPPQDTRQDFGSASDTAASHEAMPDSAAAVNGSGSTLTAQAYSGRWQGVEGTYMIITPKDNAEFDLIIADLDGPKTYKGMLQADGLHVKRDGEDLIVRPGNGAATGMKWLSDKKDCVIVAANEGYCRD